MPAPGRLVPDGQRGPAHLHGPPLARPGGEPGAGRTAVQFRDHGLTGWDLAGPEEAYPDPMLHVEAFAVAREGGLRITIHAGEWGGAAQVRRALAVEPERIAHGPGAIDDPQLCAELSRGR